MGLFGNILVVASIARNLKTFDSVQTISKVMEHIQSFFT